MYPWNWQKVPLKGLWPLEVTNAGRAEGPAPRTPMSKSERASDATNMFGIVIIRRFKNITKNVMKFPTNKNNKISHKNPDSRISFALLLDFKSLDISAS